MSSRRGFRDSDVAGPQGGSLRLQDRDRSILSDLYRFGAVDRDQLLRLGYFDSIPRCNFRMRQLQSAGLVARTAPPISSKSQQTIYVASSRAASIICEHLGVDHLDVARRLDRTPSAALLNHTLRIVGLRLATEEAATRASVSLEKWLTEIECRHEYSLQTGGSRGWTNQIFKPDSYLQLRLDSQSWSFFVEVDCGTVSARKFSQKLVSFEQYRNGVFQDTYGLEDFEVLVVTTSPIRLSNLAALSSQSAFPVHFATFGDVCYMGFGGQIWHSPKVPSPSFLPPFRPEVRLP